MKNKFLAPIYIRLFSIIFIILLGLIIYSNTPDCPFSFDDFHFIVMNSTLRNIHQPIDIWNFFPLRFVTLYTFALNYHFNHLDVYGYHLINMMIHLISALLVWWFVLLTLSTPVMNDDRQEPSRAPVIALFAGLVFVSHPVQTEAVTYICQRLASLATLFYMASLCFYIKSRLLDSNNRTWKLVFSVGSLITACLGMFSKEITLTLPLMILLYEYSFLRTKEKFNWKLVMPYFLILFFVVMIVVLLPSAIRGNEFEGLVSGTKYISPWHYLLTQFRVIVTYIRLAFIPLHQNLDYDYPIFYSLYEGPVLISLSLIILILGVAGRLFLKYRLISFSIFWFFLTLLPESSVFPLQDLIFEHRLYLPLVGYCILIVSGLHYVGGKKSFRVLIMALVLIVGWYSILTYQRNIIWQNEFSLWNDATQKSPHKFRPAHNRDIYYVGFSPENKF